MWEVLSRFDTLQDVDWQAIVNQDEVHAVCGRFWVVSTRCGTTTGSRSSTRTRRALYVQGGRGCGQAEIWRRLLTTTRFKSAWHGGYERLAQEL